MISTHGMKFARVRAAHQLHVSGKRKQYNHHHIQCQMPKSIKKIGYFKVLHAKSVISLKSPVSSISLKKSKRTP